MAVIIVIKQRIMKYLHAEKEQYVTQVESIQLKPHKTAKFNTQKPENYVFRPDSLCVPVVLNTKPIIPYTAITDS